MSTPLATITDALIEFILSLLRDPAAMAEFESAPEATLERNGLSKVCAADVQAVKPVIIDHPQVQPRPDPPSSYHPSGPSGPPSPPNVIKEITTVAQNFHIDNRSTIIDQSVNQSIWAYGDVTQVFDQEAIIASGDGAVAAGKDVDNSKTDSTVGDVSIGNKDTHVEIDGSFNDTSTTTTTSVDADISGSFNDASTHTDVAVDVDGSFNDASATTVTNDTAVALGDHATATAGAGAGALDDVDSPAAAFADASSYDDAGLSEVEPVSDLAFDQP